MYFYYKLNTLNIHGLSFLSAVCKITLIFDSAWCVSSTLGRREIQNYLLDLKAKKVWEPSVYWYEDRGVIIYGDQWTQHEPASLWKSGQLLIPVTEKKTGRETVGGVQEAAVLEYLNMGEIW